ncbi:MAG TPA: transglutaminase domain-containing protein [Candidatus Thermoplasmatota archaeon]|nr:transglutaminase domain-containing protein [Candidatus Thermoplasmatota archaeon]
MLRTSLAFLLAFALAAGCLQQLGFGPQYRAERTQLVEPPGWNRDGRFSVRVLQAEPVAVDILAKATDGRTVQARGISNTTLPPVELQLADGTWTVDYSIAGTPWESQGPAQVDTTPPTLEGLATLGTATDGSYLLGEGARSEDGATVRVVRQEDGKAVATALPARIDGLADGLHAFDVVATDPAGNQAVATVQVRAGSATQLPPGRYTMGITTRYTDAALLWDLTRLDQDASPGAAREAVGSQWLGAGTGLDPDDPAVQGVVQDVVRPGMSSGRVAFELFRWMVDHTDYDKARLDADDLLSPAQTMQAGGGVCRDLAGLYASLLRGSGVPARLVTGYLASGTVGGFHAWVEFYGGEGHGPGAWVPVDVSAVDGTYSPLVALQAFGSRSPDMLGLNALSPAQEQGDWSHVSSIEATYPHRSPPPDAQARHNLTIEFREHRTLCVDPERLARRVVGDPSSCGSSYPLYSPHFLSRASYVLDYGLEVEQASPGTTITVALAYPLLPALAPDTLDSLTYGASFQKDPATGKATATYRS